MRDVVLTILSTSHDGSLVYVPITAKNLEGALQVMRDGFFVNENVSIALGVANDPQAIQELTDFLNFVIAEGVSYAAIDKQTGKVAGVAINKIHFTGTMEEELKVIRSLGERCSRQAAKDLIDYSIYCTDFSFFKDYNIDCAAEVMFLSVLPEYRGKGIAKRLTEISIEQFEKLNKGENIRQGLNGIKLPLEPIPKATILICTSFITQKITKQLGFKILGRKLYKDIYFHGKCLAESMNNGVVDYTLEFKFL